MTNSTKECAPYTVFNDFLSAEKLTLIPRVLPHQIRKIRFDNIENNTELPSEIKNTIADVQRKFPEIKLNTSILKRYSINDRSTAYEFHRDPDEFMTEPLILITLSGEADLHLEIFPNKFEIIKCIPGTMVVLNDPTLRHKISPPKSKDGIREILFFGFSSKKNILP